MMSKKVRCTGFGTVGNSTSEEIKHRDSKREADASEDIRTLLYAD